MKKEIFEELLNKLHIEKEKTFLMKDVDSIILNNGIGIYPNWVHMRFLITSKDDILIQYGESKPYGGRLSSDFQFKVGFDEVVFASPKPVLIDGFSTEVFRNPQAGDILYATNMLTRSTQEAFIKNVYNDGIHLYASLNKPIFIEPNSRLTFYDPFQYNDKDCVHGTEEFGVYLKYSPNEGKTIKHNGILFHQIIKLKDIKEIKLSLKSKNTYSIS